MAVFNVEGNKHSSRDLFFIFAIGMANTFLCFLRKRGSSPQVSFALEFVKDARIFLTMALFV